MILVNILVAIVFVSGRLVASLDRLRVGGLPTEGGVGSLDEVVCQCSRCKIAVDSVPSLAGRGLVLDDGQLAIVARRGSFTG